MILPLYLLLIKLLIDLSVNKSYCLIKVEIGMRNHCICIAVFILKKNQAHHKKVQIQYLKLS